MVFSKNICIAVLLSSVLLICRIRSVLPQVTVQVRETLEATDGHIISDTYIFPEGFSNPLDWFVTPYANIPSEGTTAILYWLFLEDSCSEIQPLTEFCDEINMTANVRQHENLTRWALVDGYHMCTQEKIEQVRSAKFDGIITFSYNNSDLDVSSQVLDRASGVYIDVEATGFPIVVVSEQFASALQGIAITANTSSAECYSTLISINGDLVRQNWIMFAVAFSMVFVIIGLPIFICLCLCCCLCDLCINGCPKCQSKVTCSCRCCRNSGLYEVNQIHIRVLGDDVVLRQPYLEEETSFGATGDISTDRFQRVYETSIEPRTRKYRAVAERNISCSICLECFDEEETVHALSCDEHHVFHPHCIEQWLETHSVCPVCRAFVIQPNF